MRAIQAALCAAISLLCYSTALAQTPKFTIVSVTTDPAGPIAPGSKFKIKVIVRNDGDTIPTGRGFQFVFASSDPVAIAQPTGTPALFFGFCPGATPVNMACSCFAAWEKGQTVEMETEVTVGSTARGSVTVTFTVRLGTVTETRAVTVQIAVGPAADATLVITPKKMTNVSYLGLIPAFELQPLTNARVGYNVMIEVEVKNIGNAATTGQLVVVVNLQAGVWQQWMAPRDVIGDSCSDFAVHPSMLVATHTSTKVVPPNDSITLCFGIVVGAVPPGSTGATPINGVVSAGGDVNVSNNSYTVPAGSFTISPAPPAQPFFLAPPATTKGRR